MARMDLCAPGQRTAGQNPGLEITNLLRRVYMCPVSSPRERAAMSANGSQVHEFAPPGSPGRRGLHARQRAGVDRAEEREDPGAALGEGTADGRRAAPGTR